MDKTFKTVVLQKKGKLVRAKLAIIELFAIVVLLAVLITDDAVWMWLSPPVFLLVWCHVALRNYLLRRNIQGLHNLSVDSEESDDNEDLPGITVISPARNEKANIEKAIRSLAAQDYPHLEVIVANGHSTDGTTEILRALEKELPQIRVINDPPLQDGWSGKANAIWHAVHAANPNNKWLLLTDADVVYHSKAIRRALAHVEAKDVDFCTGIPRIDNRTLAEELVIPHKWSAIIMCAHYDRLNTDKTRAIGIGAFTLVKRDVYLESGGHSAFYFAQPEDTLLARLIKNCGKKMDVVWTRDMLSVRVYQGLRQVLECSARKSRILFDDSLIALTSQVFRWLLTMVLPLPLATAALVQQMRSGFSIGMATYALIGLGTYYSGVRNYQLAKAFCRIRRGVPWLFPIGGLVKLCIEIKGMIQIFFRMKMAWRDREFINMRTLKPETRMNKQGK